MFFHRLDLNISAFHDKPRTSKIFHHRQEEQPEFWSVAKFGQWSTTDFFALRFPSANRSNSNKYELGDWGE